MELNDFESKLATDYLYLKIQNVQLVCENEKLKAQLKQLQPSTPSGPEQQK